MRTDSGVDALDRFATVCFLMSLVQCLFLKPLLRKFVPKTRARLLFHLLEFEWSFALWAAVLLVFIADVNFDRFLSELGQIAIRGPLTVFLLMMICSNRWIFRICTQVFRGFASWLTRQISRIRPVSFDLVYFTVLLGVGPLFGSLLSETAAMTVLSSLISLHFFSRQSSSSFKYATMAVLFVNVSIGGTLTPFAAPPVVIVAQSWGWGLKTMLTYFGIKAVEANLVSALWLTVHFRHEIRSMPADESFAPPRGPIWLLPLKIGVFLLALSVLMAHQTWWLEYAFGGRNELSLYFGAILLTAGIDNAVITSIALHLQNLSEFGRYAIVAGSVVGGGLTVLANVPNLIGFEVLSRSFSEPRFSHVRFFLFALMPTAIALLAFLIF